MIKHIIFTDHVTAKLFCYELATLVTTKQLRVGEANLSGAISHPDGLRWSVQVDESIPEVSALIQLNGYSGEFLDDSWNSYGIEAGVPKLLEGVVL